MALSKQSQGQERAISFPIDAKVEGQEPSLSVLYTAGQRPAEEDIQRILAKADLASLGREVAPDDHRLDVLAGGLTFEMEGVSPGAPADLPAARHFFGMVDTRESFPFEAITLAPAGEAAGLGGGGAVLPVVQVMADIATLLAAASPVRALCWQPAGSWMDVAYFSRVSRVWRSGGAFPALGLTGLERREDGSVVSDGLAFFIGQELRVDGRAGEHATDTMRLAVRAVDHLVREGTRLTEARVLRGPQEEPITVEPSLDGATIMLLR